MTFDDAADALAEAGQLSFDAPLLAAAQEAVKRIQRVWPVDTGRSRDGWRAEATTSGAIITNPVGYTEHVHDRLADTLVPQILTEVLQDFASQRIDDLLRGALE